jgi:hypothetical protein
MVTDTQAQQRLADVLTTFSAKWAAQGDRVECVLSFEDSLAEHSWSAALTAHACDYLSAALYLDAGLQPDSVQGPPPARLEQALRRWLRTTTAHPDRPTPQIGLDLYLRSVTHDGQGSVHGFPLDIGQASRLGLVARSMTPTP